MCCLIGALCRPWPVVCNALMKVSSLEIYGWGSFIIYRLGEGSKRSQTTQKCCQCIPLFSFDNTLWLWVLYFSALTNGCNKRLTDMGCLVCEPSYKCGKCKEGLVVDFNGDCVGKCSYFYLDRTTTPLMAHTGLTTKTPASHLKVRGVWRGRRLECDAGR